MNTLPSIRVACVEDDPHFQAFLRKILVPERGFELLDVFNNAEQAVASILDSRPDVVLLDMKLPGKTGIDCLGMLECHMPATAFVMLTGDDTPQQVFAALKAGACGYVLKTAPTEHLLEAVRAAALGGGPLSPAISRVVISAFQTKSAKVQPRIPGITHREDELLGLFVKGLSANGIGTRSCHLEVIPARQWGSHHVKPGLAGYSICLKRFRSEVTCANLMRCTAACPLRVTRGR